MSDPHEHLENIDDFTRDYEVTWTLMSLQDEASSMSSREANSGQSAGTTTGVDASAAGGTLCSGKRSICFPQGFWLHQ